MYNVSWMSLTSLVFFFIENNFLLKTFFNLQLGDQAIIN